ncbi:ecotin family protein [Flavobacterium akiainvivens]|uniref:ecotin family protein n=1 Tax=Flavobacterium akiainvivens TaxID=1202724 RepID=UPI0006C8E074|nr:ecotin family protein [Flavobacterium akiainvivens]SFQ54069.1 ecotin [Flavobacterium akiainvivens]
MKNTLLLITLLLSFITYSQNKPTYPEAKKGFKRVDIMLPKIENEENYKVEVRFGIKHTMVECAKGDFSLGRNNLTEKYGIPNSSRFPYYVVEDVNGDISVGMPSGCESTTKIEKTILSTEEVIFRYQSYFPVPFYIPGYCTLEYRVWSTTDTYNTLK